MTADAAGAAPAARALVEPARRSGPVPWGEGLILLAALLVAWALPLATLGAQSLWGDETWTWYQATRPTLEVIGLSIDVEPHPPLGYLIVHFFVVIAGTSEFVLRFPSAAAGPLLVAGGYVLARRLTPGAAPFAVWLLAVAPFQVSQGQFARNYALAAALAVISAAAFEIVLARPTRSRAVRLAILSLITFYLHALAILPFALFCLVRLARGPHLRYLSIALWVFAIGAAPWAIAMGRHAAAPAVPEWRSAPSLPLFLGQSASILAVGPVNEVWPVSVVVVAVLALAVLVAIGIARGQALTLPAAAAGIGAVVLVGAVSLVVPIYHERYLGLFAPFVLLGAAGGAVSGLPGFVAGMVAWVAGAAASVALVAGAIPNDDLRGLTRDLLAQIRPGDVVLTSGTYARLPVQYYGGSTIEWRGSVDALAHAAVRSDAAVERPPAYGVMFIDRGPKRPSALYPTISGDDLRAGLDGIGARFERVWLVRLYDTVSDPTGLVVAESERRWQRLSEQTYPGSAMAQLRLYRTVLPHPAEVPAGFTRLDVRVPGLGRLAGWRWHEAPLSSPRSAILQIAWQADGPTTTDLRTFVHVLSADGHRVGGADVVTGRPVPPGGWRPGEILIDEVSFALPDSGLSHAVRIGAYDGTSGRRLRIGDDDSIVIGFLPPGGGPIDQDSIARFAAGQELLSAEIPSGPVEPGSEVPVRLAWRFGESLAEDVTVFLHLVDGSGKPIAQADGPVLRGLVPNQELPLHQVIREQRLLQVPDDTSSGSYRVLIGLYARTTGERLRLVRGSQRDDAIDVGAIRVERRE